LLTSVYAASSVLKRPTGTILLVRHFCAFSPFRINNLKLDFGNPSVCLPQCKGRTDLGPFQNQCQGLAAMVRSEKGCLRSSYFVTKKAAPGAGIRTNTNLKRVQGIGRVRYEKGHPSRRDSELKRSLSSDSFGHSARARIALEGLGGKRLTYRRPAISYH